MRLAPRDHVFEFHAFTTSFDGADDSDGDSDAENNDKFGVPEWVAFEVRKQTVKISAGSSSWKSEETLDGDGIASVAPTDDSYKHTQAIRKAFPVSLTYNLSRGHMCPRNIAKRLSADATANTFTRSKAGRAELLFALGVRGRPGDALCRLLHKTKTGG